MIRVVRNLGDARIPIGRLRFLSLGTWTRRIGWWRYFIAFSRLCRSVKFLSRSCPYRTFVTPYTPTAPIGLKLCGGSPQENQGSMP
jgi:hypothetical protein